MNDSLFNPLGKPPLRRLLFHNPLPLRCGHHIWRLPIRVNSWPQVKFRHPKTRNSRDEVEMTRTVFVQGSSSIETGYFRGPLFRPLFGLFLGHFCNCLLEFLQVKQVHTSACSKFDLRGVFWAFFRAKKSIELPPWMIGVIDH